MLLLSILYLFLTNNVKMKIFKMSNFGIKVRKLREELKLPLRKVAAYLDIDQAILSKIERGQRAANRQQVIKLALYFQADKNDLLTTWLSDKILEEIEHEEMAAEAIKEASIILTQIKEK